MKTKIVTKNNRYIFLCSLSNKTISNLLTNNTAKKITLTAQDKVDLIAFLSTLEDFQLPLDKRFDDPFKK